MSIPIRRHPEVDKDILGIAAWIFQHSREAAERFLTAVEGSICSLQVMPGKGSPKSISDKRLAGLRSWAVRGFSNHLIYYQIKPHYIYVMAVLHGARNIRLALKRRGV